MEEKRKIYHHDLKAPCPMKRSRHRTGLRAAPLVHFSICSFAPRRPHATMRAHCFVLVACTATLTGSTSASEPSSPTMTKIEPAADIRSAHADHDGVAFKKPLELHDHKAGEERVGLAVNNVEAIEATTHELVNAFFRRVQAKAGPSTETKSVASFKDALGHYLETQFEDTDKGRAHLADIYARQDPNELAHLRKAAHAVYRAHQEETALAEIMEEMQRFDTHPLAVLRMIIPIYNDVGNPKRPSADIVFEELKEYIKMYNAKRPDEPPIAMLPTLFEGFGNLARLKSFLSDVKPNPNYAQEVNRMEQLLAEFQMRLINMFDALALEVGIAPQGQSFLANHNMESFVTYIWSIINSLPPGRQNIFAELKVMSEANPAAI